MAYLSSGSLVFLMKLPQANWKKSSHGAMEESNESIAYTAARTQPGVVHVVVSALVLSDKCAPGTLSSASAVILGSFSSEKLNESRKSRFGKRDKIANDKPEFVCSFSLKITETKDITNAATAISAKMIIAVNVFSKAVRCFHQLGFLKSKTEVRNHS